MATNQTGIAIVIKAFLPTGKTLDETYAALTVVKTAHETGNYAPLLALAKIDEVKTEQKTRRVEAETQEPSAEDKSDGAAAKAALAEYEAKGGTTMEEVEAEISGTEPADPALDLDPAADVPDFLKGKKKKAA